MSHGHHLNHAVIDEFASTSSELLRAWSETGTHGTHGVVMFVTTAGQPDDGQFAFYPWCANRCGAYVDDGPFRFCSTCRQVDLSTIKYGGGR